MHSITQFLKLQCTSLAVRVRMQRKTKFPNVRKAQKPGTSRDTLFHCSQYTCTACIHALPGSTPTNRTNRGSLLFPEGTALLSRSEEMNRQKNCIVMQNRTVHTKAHQLAVYGRSSNENCANIGRKRDTGHGRVWVSEWVSVCVSMYVCVHWEEVRTKTKTLRFLGGKHKEKR